MDSPPKTLLFLEAARGLLEYIQSILLSAPLQFISPRGDGHPVMVFPGLGASDTSTRIMRQMLSNLGYTVYTWGQGRNLGPRDGIDKLTRELTTRTQEISAKHGNQKVTLIGWSLGGIYVREVAKLAPSLVRQVITLGTPFKGQSGATNATFLYELLSKDKSHHDPEFVKALAVKPEVPFTSIYSKTDGVVSWKCSIEEETDISQNIEVLGASHVGLGHNPIVLFIVAKLLAQKEDEWELYSK